MSAHDAWLANYHQHATTVYCNNPKCSNHDGITVTWISEYGQSWIEPEDCPDCRGELLDDRPDDDQDAL